MKKTIKAMPIIGSLAKAICSAVKINNPTLRSSKDYWEQRYRNGGNSGAGSYDKLAIFKADVLNSFVEENHIETIIEYGCGDGNQLTLSQYPSYIGFDVSNKAIELCKKTFHNDKSKQFKLLSEHRGETAQLTLSLD